MEPTFTPLKPTTKNLATLRNKLGNLRNSSPVWSVDSQRYILPLELKQFQAIMAGPEKPLMNVLVGTQWPTDTLEITFAPTEYPSLWDVATIGSCVRCQSGDTISCSFTVTRSGEALLEYRVTDFQHVLADGQRQKLMPHSILLSAAISTPSCTGRSTESPLSSAAPASPTIFGRVKNWVGNLLTFGRSSE